jgi:hypothetical protein
MFLHAKRRHYLPTAWFGACLAANSDESVALVVVDYVGAFSLLLLLLLF